MIECPSCRRIHEGQPKFCEKCGYPFGSATSSAPITPTLKKCPDCAEEVRTEARRCRFCGFVFPKPAHALTRGQKWILAMFTVVIILLVALATRPKVRAALERTEARGAVSRLPDRVRKAEAGVTTTIGGSGFSWPCAPYTSDLAELMKLRKLVLTERAPEFAIATYVGTLKQSKSIEVDPGMHVKILLAQDDIRKISLVDANGDYLWQGVGYQAEASHGCWVASEAVTR